MRRPAPEKLVYAYLFPRPKPADPQNFHEFLERNLVLEVRQEVHSFYGHLDTQEAKYPGLDYSHPGHRVRLSRWQWHRRLFRAFDYLGLTPYEIANLTKWEGTRWAKERYEKEQNITIRDSAADGMPDYRASRSPPTVQERVQDFSVEHKPSWQARCQPEQEHSQNSSITLRTTLLPSRPALRTTISDLLYSSRSTTPRPQLPPLPSLQPLLQDSISMASQMAAADPEPDIRGGHMPTTDFTQDTSMAQENECDDSIDSIRSAGSAGSAGSADSADSADSAGNTDSVDPSVYMQLVEQPREHAVSPDMVNSLTLMGIESDEWYKSAMESRQIMAIPELRFVHSSFSSEFPALSQFPGESQLRPQEQSQSQSQPSLQNMLGTGLIDVTPSGSASAHILESARQGNWDNVPPFLHDVLNDANRMTEGT